VVDVALRAERLRVLLSVFYVDGESAAFEAAFGGMITEEDVAAALSGPSEGDMALLNACLTLERQWLEEGFAALELLDAVTVGQDGEALVAAFKVGEAWAIDAVRAMARVGWLRDPEADPWPGLAAGWRVEVAERRVHVERLVAEHERLERIVREGRVGEAGRLSIGVLGRLASRARRVWMTVRRAVSRRGGRG
jgi:hypothetical protein